MKKKILIIGGTGFIGFHLINLLKKKKYEIVSVSKNRLTKKRVQNIKYIFCKLQNKKELKKKLNFRLDFIVNFAGHINHNEILYLIHSLSFYLFLQK